MMMHTMYFVGTFFRIMQDFRFVESEPAGPGARDEILEKEAKEAEKLKAKGEIDSDKHKWP